jgi:hypothetical protein
MDLVIHPEDPVGNRSMHDFIAARDGGFLRGRRRALHMSIDFTKSLGFESANPPEEWISLCVDKEVLSKRVRTTGLPSGYVDQ